MRKKTVYIKDLTDERHSPGCVRWSCLCCFHQHFLFHFDLKCWGSVLFEALRQAATTHVLQSKKKKASYRVVTVYYSDVYLKLLLLFVCFLIYFLLICIIFLTSLGLLCLCQKEKSIIVRKEKEFNNGDEKAAETPLLKLSAMWERVGGECVFQRVC